MHQCKRSRIRVGLTDLGFSCEAPPPPTRACGPWRPQAPSTKSRADLTVLQDGPRGASTDASPSWAMRVPSLRDAATVTSTTAKQGRRCDTPGPRHQCRMRVTHQPRGRGPCFKAPLGSCFGPDTAAVPARSRRVPRSAESHADTNLKRATPRRLHPNTATIREHTATAAGQQSIVTRALFEPTQRVLLACTTLAQHDDVDPGRASLEARPAAWHRPSALRDAPIANDHFSAVAQRTWRSAARPAPPRRKPAGPGARRRPSTMVALTSPNIKTPPARPCQLQRLVGPHPVGGLPVSKLK